MKRDAYLAAMGPDERRFTVAEPFERNASEARSLSE
jgi:hypothetical protein